MSVALRLRHLLFQAAHWANYRQSWSHLKFDLQMLNTSIVRHRLPSSMSNALKLLYRYKEGLVIMQIKPT